MNFSVVVNSGCFKKGMVPWNKGKELSLEHIKNLSVVHIGKKQSEETIEKRVKQFRGDKHKHWKGEKVGYIALHQWLDRTYGNPDHCEMEGCKYPRKNWDGKLMLKPHHYEWSNKNGDYSRNIVNWWQLCPSCHRTYDTKRII